ncbi:M42 family metallopeptidase [Candidatus Sumerlaeota bacterium]|nr:M42 family metallopeptidase [Candidatus Sumerlaeota bacterium]
MLTLLKELCDAFGPTGFESEVRDRIRARIAPLADEVRETPVGSLLALRRGHEPRGTVLLDAHMDEVGLIVNRIEPNGFVRFATLGAIDPRVLPSHRVEVRSRSGARRVGVIGTRPPHIVGPEQRTQAMAVEDLFIDLGCSSREAVESLEIGLGAPAVIHYPFVELSGGRVAAKALDDRAGCALVLSAFEALEGERLPFDLAASFSVQEEAGQIGAETAAREIAPDVALVLESTTATDTPDVPPSKHVCSLGLGPAITIVDARTFVPEKMFRFLEGLAREGGIPYQFKPPRVGGGTNAGAIQRRGAGVLTGILSVPCRYIHSPTGVLSMKDLSDCADLLSRFLRNAERLFRPADCA